jgi:hypothetical protein
MVFMKILKTLIPPFLFTVIGLFGVYSQEYIQTNKPFYYWFIIPSFVLGVYYAFALTSKHSKDKGGGVALGRIAITIFITFLSFRSIQGYIIYFNCYVGQQAWKQVIGTVSQIDFKKPKQLFDKHSIVVSLEHDEEKISLDVPTDKYYIGQPFSKKMMIGSFGILYISK